MSALQDVAYLDLFGRPLIFYLGLLTYVLLVVTVVLQMLRLRARSLRRIPRGLHHLLGLVTLGVATVHGILSISVYF